MNVNRHKQQKITIEECLEGTKFSPQSASSIPQTFLSKKGQIRQKISKTERKSIERKEDSFMHEDIDEEKVEEQKLMEKVREKLERKIKKITFRTDNFLDSSNEVFEKASNDVSFFGETGSCTEKPKKFKQMTDLSEESSIPSAKVLTKKQIASSKTSKSIKTLKTLKSFQSQKQEIKEEGEIIDVVKKYIIGEGVHGKVYKGKSKRLGKNIAIKKFFQSHRHKNREVEILREVKGYPYIVEMYQAYTIKKQNGIQLQIMMEHYETDLSKKIDRQGNISLQLTRIYAYQLFRALHFLHSLQLVHRDINPTNILLTGDKLVLCDFGSAKKIQENEASMIYIGSRSYRAPQLIFRNPYYSQTVDIWSAGCVLVEMITGQPLFESQNSFDLFYEIIKVRGTPSTETLTKLNRQYRQIFQNWSNFPNFQKKDWQHILMMRVDKQLQDLLEKIFQIDPNKRITSIQVLKHGYFERLRQKEQYEEMMKNYRLDENLFHFMVNEIEAKDEQCLIPDWYRQQYEACQFDMYS